jgi:hypothetical protein
MHGPQVVLSVVPRPVDAITEVTGQPQPQVHRLYMLSQVAALAGLLSTPTTLPLAAAALQRQAVHLLVYVGLWGGRL